MYYYAIREKAFTWKRIEITSKIYPTINRIIVRISDIIMAVEIDFFDYGCMMFNDALAIQSI